LSINPLEIAVGRLMEGNQTRHHFASAQATRPLPHL
jgi:hypothetical protein